MEGFLHLPSRETHQNARKGGFRAGFSYSALTLWSPQISDFFEKHSLTLSSPLLTLPEPFSPKKNCLTLECLTSDEDQSRPIRTFMN